MLFLRNMAPWLFFSWSWWWWFQTRHTFFFSCSRRCPHFLPHCSLNECCVSFPQQQHRRVFLFWPGALFNNKLCVVCCVLEEEEEENTPTYARAQSFRELSEPRHQAICPLQKWRTLFWLDQNDKLVIYLRSQNWLDSRAWFPNKNEIPFCLLWTRKQTHTVTVCIPVRCDAV